MSKKLPPVDKKASDTKSRENLVGDNLRYLMRQRAVERGGRKLTAYDLGKAISVSYKTVYHWIQGLSSPDAKSRQRLCDYFDITESELFSRGLALGTQGLEEETIHNLIVKLGLEGVTPDDLKRLSEKEKGILKDLIKDFAGRRSQQAIHTIAARGAAPGARKSVKSILIVDDEARICIGLQAKLRELGYRVFIAADGSEAFRRIEEHKPNLVVLDLRMVGMGGVEFLRKLRKDDATTKVIVISAYPDELVNLHAENLKIEGYFDKPYPLEDLLEQVEKSIGGAAA